MKKALFFFLLLTLPYLAKAQIVATNNILALSPSLRTLTVAQGGPLIYGVYTRSASSAVSLADDFVRFIVTPTNIPWYTSAVYSVTIMDATNGQAVVAATVSLPPSTYHAQMLRYQRSNSNYVGRIAWDTLVVTHPFNATVVISNQHIASLSSHYVPTGKVAVTDGDGGVTMQDYGSGGGDQTVLSNRVGVVESYTNRAATAMQSETGTLQSVLNRGGSVTGTVDYSLSAGVRVPTGDFAPNAPITRADATQLVATVIVSGAVTRLIFNSGSVMVTQVANAIEFPTNDFTGATVSTNAELIIVTPHLRSKTVAGSTNTMPPGPYTTHVTFDADDTWTNSAQGAWVTGVSNGYGYIRSTNEASTTTRVFMQHPISQTNSPWCAAVLLVGGPSINVASYYYWGLANGTARSGTWYWAANVGGSGAAGNPWNWGGHSGTPGSGISALTGGTTEFPSNPSTESLASLGIHNYPYWMLIQYDGTSRWHAGWAPYDSGQWRPYIVQSKTNMEPTSLIGIEATTRASDSNPYYYFLIKHLILKEGDRWVNL